MLDHNYLWPHHNYLAAFFPSFVCLLPISPVAAPTPSHTIEQPQSCSQGAEDGGHRAPDLRASLSFSFLEVSFLCHHSPIISAEISIVSFERCPSWLQPRHLCSRCSAWSSEDEATATDTFFSVARHVSTQRLLLLANLYAFSLCFFRLLFHFCLR
jgi:hypothetical protein